MSDGELLQKLLGPALWDTVWTMAAASFFALLFGLPLGLLLYATAKGHLFENSWINRPLSAFITALRAVPFIILAVSLIPLTRLVVGTSIGNSAAVFVLSVTAIPFYARMAELSFREVDKNLIQAVLSMGATRLQTLREVVLPESLPSLISGFTVTIIAIIAASSMVGFIGGNGLGRLAISYGYQRYNPTIMIAVIAVLIALNVAVQWFGDRLAQKAARVK